MEARRRRDPNTEVEGLMRRRLDSVATIVFVSILVSGCGGEQGSTPTSLDESRLDAGGPGVVVPVTASHAAPIISHIEIIGLGTLPGGMHSTAADINDAGAIVGTSGTSSGEDHAFLLTGSGFTDLGTLPGGDQSRGSGLNDMGQVVGSARNDVGVTHAFEWQSGLMRDLGAFPPQDDIGSESRATSINNSGLVSGNVDLAGVVWDLSGTPNFPPFPPYVRVTDPAPFSPARSSDINDAGQVVGTLLAQARGFRWQSGVLEPLVVLQTLDDNALGINAAGVAVGRGLLAPPVRHHAVVWPDPATIIDLGTLGGDNSAAFDINADGLVVGESETGTGETVAFLWTEELGMQSLGTLGGANSSAAAVNAEGHIVGESETADGDVHATLWIITVATEVTIDIKPGSDPNSVNPRSKGVIPVAILSEEHFDATTVVPLSVEFGPNGAGEAHGRGHVEDVDGDGVDDLVLHFRTQETGIQCGDSEATLTGETTSGDAVQGTDSVRTVGCS